MTTFVSIGNAHQPFERLLNGVLDNLDILPHPVIVQCGHTRYKDSRCKFSSFYDLDEYNYLIQTSELLILHAGGGSIIKALQAGKRPVVMPRREKYCEHTNDHQLIYALELDKMKIIELALEPSDLKDSIVRALNNDSGDNNVTRNDYAIKVMESTIEYFDNYFRKDKVK